MVFAYVIRLCASLMYFAYVFRLCTSLMYLPYVLRFVHRLCTSLVCLPDVIQLCVFSFSCFPYLPAYVPRLFISHVYLADAPRLCTSHMRFLYALRLCASRKYFAYVFHFCIALYVRCCLLRVDTCIPDIRKIMPTIYCTKGKTYYHAEHDKWA